MLQKYEKATNLANVLFRYVPLNGKFSEFLRHTTAKYQKEKYTKEEAKYLPYMVLKVKKHKKKTNEIII